MNAVDAGSALDDVELDAVVGGVVAVVAELDDPAAVVLHDAPHRHEWRADRQAEQHGVDR
jgi:hypothetical protein